MHSPRDDLTALVRGQAAERACWERAAAHLMESAVRARLEVLGIRPTPDLAVAMMAAAMVLAESSPEWGGDYRDALGDVALLGLGLLGE